jgi:hypothetical protein
LFIDLLVVVVPFGEFVVVVVVVVVIVIGCLI